MKHAFFFFFILLFSSCAVGYRKVNFSSEIVRNDGRRLQVAGESDTALLMVHADFRYARFSLPIELGAQTWDFRADDGGQVKDRVLKERRFYRVDAPLLSFYRIDQGLGVWYPGLLPKRKSLEFWVGAEMDPIRSGHRWFDIGLMYYHYGLIGVRAYAGMGSEKVRTSTKSGMKSTLFWDDSGWGYGGGIEFSIAPGEYFLEFLEFLFEKDQRHQRRLKYKRYGR